MTDIIKGFFVDLVNSTVEMFGSQLMTSFEAILRVETLTDILSAEVVQAIYQYIYFFVSSLIVLKFLYKGFSIYVMWRDGDADSSPQDMLIGAIQAIIVIIAFPTLYNIIANVTLEFTSTILSLIKLPETGSSVSGSAVGDAFAILPLFTMGIADILILIIYLILFLVLYVKLLQRGFELLILRLGIPFACMGMIDSDYGIWKSYIQVLFKTLFTSIIQLVTLTCSLSMVSTGHIIIGIVLISVAFQAPLILQQIMVPTGRGGGVINKIYTGSMAMKTIRSIRGG